MHSFVEATDRNNSGTDKEGSRFLNEVRHQNGTDMLLFGADMDVSGSENIRKKNGEIHGRSPVPLK